MSGAVDKAPDCAGRNGAHTPGPWVTEWELSKGAFCQVAAFSTEGNRVLRCAIESFRPGEDARLIAAAPDLLAALNEAFDFLGGVDDAGAIRATICAAIAKAEGRTNA